LFKNEINNGQPTLGLIDKLSSDQVVAHRIMKINDVLRKNPEYGRSQTIDYMHQVVSENEKVIIDHKKTTDKLRSIISDLQNFLNDVSF
jgi:hypothetical protein